MASERDVLKKRFAIVLLWHEDAETETAQKYRRAAANQGIECVLIDHRGHRLDDRTRLDLKEVDFVIHTHFAKPKDLDVFSFVLLYSPMAFYHREHGYESYTRSLLSHDDFLSCGSVAAENQIRRSLPHQPLHLAAKFPFYPAPAEPVVEPTVRQRRLCYFRGHWDAQRYREPLLALDRAGVADFYGPAEGDWSGFANYRGKLPYDGRTIVERVAEHGAVLALTSPDHIRDGVMSNRLFEGLGAGAVVICDQNPFAREHFGDNLLYIDTRKPDLAGQVIAHIDWMNEHPDEAAEMARRAQQAFRKDFSADVCLKRIYDSFAERRKALTFGLDPAADSNPLVRVVYLLTDCSEAGLDALVAACCEQDYRRVQLQVLIEPDPAVEKAVAKRLRTLGADFRVQPVERLAERSTDSMGSVLAEALRFAQGDAFDYLCIVTSAERPYSSHLSSLMRLMRLSPGKVAGAVAEVVHPRPKEGPDELPFPTGLYDSVDFSSDIDTAPIGFAKFIFRRQMLQDESLFRLLPYLNRKAMAALTFGQPLARSGLATVLVDGKAPLFRQKENTEREDLLIRQMHPSFQPSTALLHTRLDSMEQRLRDRLARASRRKRRRRRRKTKLLLVLLVAAVGVLFWLA